MRPFKIILPLVLCSAMLACSDSSDRLATTVPEPPPPPPNPEPEYTYEAQLRRTEYGIPHIQAEDWGSLGYGFGYAYAQDNFCVVMREVVFATGRSAELMGEAEGDVNSDFLMRMINGDRESFRESFYDPMPEFAKELSRGYVAGIQRYLEETGVENLPTGDWGCRNAPWVYAFDEVDLLMFQRRISLQGSSGNGIFSGAMLAATGPDSAGANAAAASAAPAKGLRQQMQTDLRRAARQLRPVDLGSNALALGAQATQSGAGLLLGNPHQPWFGAGAWYQVHLTLPGVYDVAGVSLHGYPFIGIGFNRDLAWTHTVSFANRFSLYELKLNPDNPLEYSYEGQWRPIEARTVTIQVKTDGGELESRSRDFYHSHYGPVINLRDVSPLLDGWPMFNGSVLAFKDANLNTAQRGVELWIEKGQAGSLDEYVAALASIGNPLFHDLAADRNGDAFYGEISAIPLLTQAQLDDCIEGAVGPLLAAATTNVILSLDGSRAACEWGDSPEAPAGTGLYPSSALPQIRTRDYVGNSNNGYWLSDANNPLEGFPTIMGPVGYEGRQQFLRTRLGHIMVAERKAASDGLSDTPLFDLATLKGLMYANRVYGAEVVLDDVLTICDDEAAAEVMPACEALANWDRRVNLDSRGAQVFTEFWAYIRSQLGNDFQNVVQSDTFWREDFDAANPLHTPAGIDVAIAENRVLVIAALAEAIARLEAAGVSLAAPWGEVQVLERNQQRVPIHGGRGNMGVYGAISASLKAGGYVNPTSGNSYIQAVTWDESECPIADVILVPSQSTDPDSPHFADQTELYAQKQWVRFPFCEADIAAQQIGQTLLLQAP